MVAVCPGTGLVDWWASSGRTTSFWGCPREQPLYRKKYISHNEPVDTHTYQPSYPSHEAIFTGLSAKVSDVPRLKRSLNGFPNPVIIED